MAGRFDLTPDRGGVLSAKPIDPDGAQAAVEARTVVVIEPRSFVRECLIRSIAAVTGWSIASYETPAAFLRAGDTACSLVVLCVGDGAFLEEEGEGPIVADIAARAPIALMADSEEPSQIVAALERGVHGYIPTSVPLQVAVEAMRLVRAGGIYIPASSLIASQKAHSEPVSVEPQSTSLFTTRQIAVIEALRKGKANKIIAYELNMRESTVKVHVRNIMKKLNARNRTEVAYLANAMKSGEAR